MKTKILIAIGLAVILAIAIVAVGSAVSGAAFTTFNAHVDGASKDVCKNSPINCNIYGAKEYVWLNGGPAANGLGPDGQYFFTVLVPGGQPNPNDQGKLPDKNLSDDYDCYQNRIFTVTNGEVSAYPGNFDCSSAVYTGYTPFRHWLDDGKSGSKPNWKVPYIRLFPYSDTTNPGGVYIMAICRLDEGYPVDPRDCKYDAFKVKKGKVPYQFSLSGIKFEDTFADGVKDPTAVDPGLPDWTITIKGTGPDGQPIDATAVTGLGGFWSWDSQEYSFTGGAQPGPVHLEICEALQPDWHQSYPSPSCYTRDFTPVLPSYDSFENLDFGNWYPGEKSGLKFEDLDADGAPRESGEPGLAGWTIYIDYNGNATLDAGEPYAVTGTDGKYTITGIKPGTYTIYEVLQNGWTCSFPNPCNYEHKFYSRAAFKGNDFGNWYPATKGGYKWYDRNGNGAWDENEPAIPGWKIEVYAGGVLVDWQYTDVNGYYEFTLKPGTYTVKEVCPSSNWYQTWPVPTGGCGSGVYTVTLVSRWAEKDNNFGNYCTGQANFDTKGYWHNKNGLYELYNDPDFPTLLAYINSQDPYNDPSGYFDNGEEFFDGYDEFGNPVPPAIDSFGDYGYLYNEISQFLVDPNAGGGGGDQEQLAQQLLAFIFNVNYRLENPGTAIYVNGSWMSAQSIIDAAVAAWTSPTTDDDKYWEPILDGLNNNDAVKFISFEPCKFVCP